MYRTNESIRSASGKITDSRPLVKFLYLLLRDHLSAGVVESLVCEAGKTAVYEYTNGWVARYAQDLADSLLASHE